MFTALYGLNHDVHGVVQTESRRSRRCTDGITTFTALYRPHHEVQGVVQTVSGGERRSRRKCRQQWSLLSGLTE